MRRVGKKDEGEWGREVKRVFAVTVNKSKERITEASPKIKAEGLFCSLILMAAAICLSYQDF